MELLIAVAVFAILSAIAYPMYQDQVRKSRRAAVQGSILQLSQFMERNYTETMNYNTSSGVVRSTALMMFSTPPHFWKTGIL